MIRKLVFFLAGMRFFEMFDTERPSAPTTVAIGIDRVSDLLRQSLLFTIFFRRNDRPLYLFSLKLVNGDFPPSTLSGDDTQERQI